MEFGIEKCAMQIIKSEKRETTEGIEQPYGKSIRRIGKKKNYKFFGMLEANTTKQAEMKEKTRKEKPQKNKKIPETKFCNRNFTKERNTWPVPIVRYYGPFLKST